MSVTRRRREFRSKWVEDDVRHLLGAFGPHARIYNVYSAGDSGEGCEVIEFTTASTGGRVPWTARVEVHGTRSITVCTVGW
jgi:hypothetical protein